MYASIAIMQLHKYVSICVYDYAAAYVYMCMIVYLCICLMLYVHFYVRINMICVFSYILYLSLDKPCNVTRDLKVRGKKATVTFSSEDPKATFKCRLDNKRFKPCK